MQKFSLSIMSSTFFSSFFNQSKSNSLLIWSNQSLSLSINREFNFFLCQSKHSSISLIQSLGSPIFPGNRRLGLFSMRNSSSIVCSYPPQKLIQLLAWNNWAFIIISKNHFLILLFFEISWTAICFSIWQTHFSMSASLSWCSVVSSYLLSLNFIFVNMGILSDYLLW